MSDYPDFIEPSTAEYCAAAGCSFTPKLVKRIVGADLAEPTPRFALQGTDLCRWHHAQFHRVLGELANLYPDVERATYTRPSSSDEAGVVSGGLPSDVGSFWNPHASVVLAELTDWADYLVRLVLRERPLPAPDVREFPRTITVRGGDGQIVRDEDDRPVTRVEIDRTVVHHTHGVTQADPPRTKLMVLAQRHAGWLSGYPSIGAHLLTDALQHQRLGMRALQAQAIKRVTLKNTVCGFVVDDDPVFGEIVCGANLYAVLHPKDAKPSEILCSANPRHPQLSRDDWDDRADDLAVAEEEGQYVELAVVEELLGVRAKRVYQLRNSEGWRVRNGLYNLRDVARTARQRKERA